MMLCPFEETEFKSVMMFLVGYLKDANGRYREDKREMELERKDQNRRRSQNRVGRKRWRKCQRERVGMKERECNDKVDREGMITSQFLFL